MSYSEKLLDVQNTIVTEFISELSQRYKLDHTELSKLWSNKNKKTANNKLPDIPSTSITGDVEMQPHAENITSNVSFTEADLKKCRVSDLKNICREKGLSVGGTKDILISRIVENENSGSKSPKSLTPEVIKTHSDNPPVHTKISSKLSQIVIKRNQFGNYEHVESRLIFNNKTQKVVGKQNPDGTIEELNPETLDLCNKYGFQFDLPDNINKGSKLADVSIEGLEDEDADSDLEEEEIFELEDEQDEEIDDDIIEEDFDEVDEF